MIQVVAWVTLTKIHAAKTSTPGVSGLGGCSTGKIAGVACDGSLGMQPMDVLECMMDEIARDKQ